MTEEIEGKKPKSTITLAKVFWVVVILAVIGGLFWWFQIRPSQIKSECGTLTGKAMAAESQKRSALEWQRTYDMVYESCLHKRGI